MDNTASKMSDPGPRPTFAILSLMTAITCLVLALAGQLPAVGMGFVQGVGEFLPISSSAHLILVPWFFGLEDGAIGTLTFDVALHLGTLVAVVGYFWRDWVALFRAAPAAARWALSRGAAPLSRDAFLLSAIVVGTIPGAVAGVLLESIVETMFRTPLLLALTLSVMGALLYVADWRLPQRRELDALTWRDALLIGVAQACALVPGVSRSGATITMGRFLSLDRAAAARFSFLLSAPITLAAFLVKLDDMLLIQASELATFAAGVIISGAVGALAIHFLLGYIRRIGFGIFAIYRFALAALIVIVYLARQ